MPVKEVRQRDFKDQLAKRFRTLLKPLLYQILLGHSVGVDQDRYEDRDQCAKRKQHTAAEAAGRATPDCVVGLSGNKGQFMFLR